MAVISWGKGGEPCITPISSPVPTARYTPAIPRTSAAVWRSTTPERRRPVALEYAERFSAKEKAMGREREIKALSRREKLTLIRNFQTVV